MRETGKERIRKARQQYLLKLQIEENERRSPDILTAVVTANDRETARRIAEIFEESAGEDLPFFPDQWARTVTVPVELYFVFQRKKDQNRFVKRMKIEYRDMEVIV